MAKEILTLNATISNGVITVNGTAETGMLAASVIVYSSDGSTILFAESTSVAANGSFAYTLDTGAKGTYIVSVADYDGNATAKTVTVSEETEKTVTEKSPKSGFETKEVIKAPPEANASSTSEFFVLAAIVVACAALGFVIARAMARRRATSDRNTK